MRFPGLHNTARIVAAAAATVVLGVAGATCWVCKHAPSSSRIMWLNRLQHDVLVSFYEGSRDETVWYIRLHVFEDILAAFLIAGLSGAYPSTASGCTAVCLALLAIVLGQLSFTVLLRPYKSRLEQGLAVVNAVIEVCVAVCALWSRWSAGQAASTAIGYCLLLANAFVQLVLLATAAIVLRLRTSGAAAGDGRMVLKPLLSASSVRHLFCAKPLLCDTILLVSRVTLQVESVVPAVRWTGCPFVEDHAYTVRPSNPAPHMGLDALRDH
jgi:hypothetical protein